MTPHAETRAALVERLKAELTTHDKIWNEPDKQLWTNISRITVGDMRVLLAALTDAPVPPATSEIERVLAQLRHAYHNLIGPHESWNREQLMNFADRLIAPQIEALERLMVAPATAGETALRIQRDIAMACADVATTGRDHSFERVLQCEIDRLKSALDRVVAIAAAPSVELRDRLNTALSAPLPTLPAETTSIPHDRHTRR